MKLYVNAQRVATDTVLVLERFPIPPLSDADGLLAAALTRYQGKSALDKKELSGKVEALISALAAFMEGHSVGPSRLNAAVLRGMLTIQEQLADYLKLLDKPSSGANPSAALLVSTWSKNWEVCFVQNLRELLRSPHCKGKLRLDIEQLRALHETTGIPKVRGAIKAREVTRHFQALGSTYFGLLERLRNELDIHIRGALFPGVDVEPTIREQYGLCLRLRYIFDLARAVEESDLPKLKVARLCEADLDLRSMLMLLRTWQPSER
jgi:hypothetical protein